MYKIYTNTRIVYHIANWKGKVLNEKMLVNSL